jgi:RNA recognition motif-containing protein
MNLYVGNLSPETTASSLRKLFSEFGEIVSSKIIMDNATGAPRGFGFVEMADKFQAQAAVDNLDMSFFEGNIISVKEARQNTTKGGGSSSGGGGNRPFRPRQQRPGGYNSGDRYNNSGSSDRYNNNSSDRYNNSGSSDRYNSDRYNNSNSNSNSSSNDKYNSL